MPERRTDQADPAHRSDASSSVDSGRRHAASPASGPTIRTARVLPLTGGLRPFWAWFGVLAGAVVGLGTAAVELALLGTAGLAVLLSRPWGRVHRAALGLLRTGTAHLVALELRRLRYFLRHDVTMERSGDARDVGYLAARAVCGIVGGFVGVYLLFVGALLGGGGLIDLLLDGSATVDLTVPGVSLSMSRWMVAMAYGFVVLTLASLWCLAVAAVERRLSRGFLGPSAQELLERRIAELTATRAGIVHAVDEERRRIERDLHDGVQQRVVALAILLGRARRSSDSEKSEELITHAHAESQQLVDELRDVAWRVYPTALDELGLESALAGVAERAGLPVSIHNGLRTRPVSAVETALYFVTREAITNAVKHAGATDVTVVLAESESPAERSVSVQVSDNGRGGVDPSGSGLTGLARRVAALDGTFRVHGPPGGPTTVTAVLPVDRGPRRTAEGR